MFRSLATAQPAPAYAKQVGDFIEPGLGHAALEPVVDVLRCNFALCGKVGGGQVALQQEGFETVTGCFHGAESIGPRTVWKSTRCRGSL